ncbi:hypothetical protein [Sporosarcina sp. D27]|uniref:hypothetical protein n=1 Tax=Sporosarcina sp. D27 TaxID=1382305 RepID=UPI000470B828|nr:hypothetical protein [Sporosarcina sp. D27]
MINKPGVAAFLLITLLCLHACSPQPRTDVKPIQETEQQLTEIPEEKEEMRRPADLGVWTTDNAAAQVLSNWCWGENGDSCSVEPEDPRELLSGMTSGRIKPGGLIQFSMGINPAWTYLSDNNVDSLLDARIDVTQIFKGVEIRYEDVGLSLTAPEEPGLYFYLATVTWEKEMKGQANYAFAFSVSPEN